MSVCVCLCGVGVGFTVSVWGFQGFGLVMFGAPGTALPRTALPGTALPGTALPLDALPLDRPKFRSFFPLPPQNSFFSSLSGGLLVEFWGCFEDRDPQMCTFQAPGASNTTKIPREDPIEGRKERILRRDREKKSAKFRAPHPSGPHFFWVGPPTLRTPTLRTPTLRGLTLRGPTFSGLGPPPFEPPPFYTHPRQLKTHKKKTEQLISKNPNN